MIKMEIVIQGRFTRYPGKESVIDRLNNGVDVRLRVEKDHKNRIVLVDCITDEAAGCIPPNPSYLEKYKYLMSAVDSGNSRFVKVYAVESCHNNHHYRAKILIPKDCVINNDKR